MDKNTTPLKKNNIHNQETAVVTLGSSIPCPSDCGFLVMN